VRDQIPTTADDHEEREQRTTDERRAQTMNSALELKMWLEVKSEVAVEDEVNIKGRWTQDKG